MYVTYIEGERGVNEEQDRDWNGFNPFMNDMRRRRRKWGDLGGVLN